MAGIRGGVIRGAIERCWPLFGDVYPELARTIRWGHGCGEADAEPKRGASVNVSNATVRQSARVVKILQLYVAVLPRGHGAEWSH